MHVHCAVAARLLDALELGALCFYTAEMVIKLLALGAVRQQLARPAVPAVPCYARCALLFLTRTRHQPCWRGSKAPHALQLAASWQLA